MSQRQRIDEALETRVMGPRLRAALEDDARRACHVLDAKYEPGVRCTVLYGLGDRLVRADLLGEDDSAGDRVDDAPYADSGRPVVAPGLRLFCYPDDPDLPALGSVTDPAVLSAALRNALPGDGHRIAGCRLRLLRYRPGRRATLGVAVRLRPARGRHTAESYVVKAYHDPGKAAAVAAEALPLEATLDRNAPLRFAPVLAFVPELSLVVQRRMAGQPLDDVLKMPGTAARAALRRAAVALAALHRQPAVSDRQRPVDHELARFAARAARVAVVDPPLGAALAGLAERLRALADLVPAGPMGLVHGDCKPSQFLLDERERVVLLDLDHCGRADPAGDVGTFLASLRQHTARQVLARRATVATVQAWAWLADDFLRQYLEAARRTADTDTDTDTDTDAGTDTDTNLRARIRWYEAVALERKALRCFARAPRSPLTEVLVRHAHSCLDRTFGGVG